MEDRRYIVYIHINKVNMKVYVGITHYSNPKKRWSYGYKGNHHFQSSITKYRSERLKISKALSKPVLMIDIKTNEVLKEFNSTTEAETFLNAKGHHISCCCNNKRKTAYGYKWKYKERRE